MIAPGGAAGDVGRRCSLLQLPAQRIALPLVDELFPGRYTSSCNAPRDANTEDDALASVALETRSACGGRHAPRQFLAAADFRAHEARVCIAQAM